jgi:DNA-binding transcriptional ArsR family regulator
VGANTAQRQRRPKQIEEVVQYAVGHRTLVFISMVLNEGIFTASQLAGIIGEPLNNVQNHLRKMLEDGSIEIAREEKKSNFVTYWYKSVEVSWYSQEEAEAMTPLQQQMTVGPIVQGGTAELFAALYVGKLRDPRSVLYWDWHHVDQQGREDLEAENVRYLERVKEIEAESTNRRCQSGEESTSMLVNLNVYERARKVGEPFVCGNDHRDSLLD